MHKYDWRITYPWHTWKRNQYFLIQLEKKDVSFTFSAHSYSPDARATTGRKTSSWRLLNPLGWASSILNDVIWLQLGLLHRAKLISTSINAELKRGFKYLTAAVKDRKWITLEVCVCVSVFSPQSHSVLIGSYGSETVQRDGDEGNAAANALPFPIWASLSHKAAAQPESGDYFCLCGEIL